MSCFSQRAVPAPSPPLLPTWHCVGQVPSALDLRVALQACVHPGNAVGDVHDRVYATAQLCTSWHVSPADSGTIST